MKRWMSSIFLLVFSLSIAAGFVFAVDKEFSKEEPKPKKRGMSKVITSLQETKEKLYRVSKNQTLASKAFYDMVDPLIQGYQNKDFTEGDIEDILEALNYCFDKAEQEQDDINVIQPMRLVTHLIIEGQVHDKHILIASILSDVDNGVNSLKFHHYAGISFSNPVSIQPLYIGHGGWSI